MLPRKANQEAKKLLLKTIPTLEYRGWSKTGEEEILGYLEDPPLCIVQAINTTFFRYYKWKDQETVMEAALWRVYVEILCLPCAPHILKHVSAYGEVIIRWNEVFAIDKKHVIWLLRKSAEGGNDYAHR